jgi:hypothetical protein
MNRQSMRLGSFRERLEQLEIRLQALVEGPARRLFPGRQISDLLAERLLLAVRDGLHVDADGKIAAPEHLIVFISPGELEHFKHARWLEELETALRAGGSEAEICFPDEHFLQVQTDPALATGEVRVTTQDSGSAISRTNGMQARADSAETEQLAEAFLIVDGTRLFPLEQPVVNIGRRPDNQLVIDDPRVSRTHAQLRVVHGRHVIFDLDSNGGTWVNGQQVRQQELSAGDVILLAGLPLVYGQESQGLGETQEYTPEG